MGFVSLEDFRFTILFYAIYIETFCLWSKPFVTLS